MFCDGSVSFCEAQSGKFARRAPLLYVLEEAFQACRMTLGLAECLVPALAFIVVIARRTLGGAQYCALAFQNGFDPCGSASSVGSTCAYLAASAWATTSEIVLA